MLTSWLLGFFLVANVYLLPGNPHSPRALDAIGVLLWLWLLRRLAGGGVRSGPLVTVTVITIVPLGWGLHGYLEGLLPTVFLSMRWVLALPVGYLLYLLAEDRRHRTSLLWGLWWGLVLNAGVLVLQNIGLEQLVYRLGLAAPDSDVITLNRYLLRSPGLHGHANASAAVASLILPIGLFLYYRGEARLWLPLISLACLLAAGHITSSRSPLIIAGIGFIVVSLTARRLIRAAVLIGLVALLVIPFWTHFGPPGGKVRWADTAHMAANTNERLASNLTAARIAADHWWGLGIEAGHRAMTESLENPATHNAFLQIGLVYGPGQAALLLLLLGMLIWHSLKGIHCIWGLEALLAVHMCGLFLFEEHLNNPTFIVLMGWLAIASVARFNALPAEVLTRRNPDATAAPTPGAAGPGDVTGSA